MTRRVDAEIDLLPSAKPLKHGARVRVHHGTAEVLGRVSIAGRVGRPRSRRARSALVRLRLESPAVLTRGDRFILRAYSPPMTIGGGVVLDPAPTRPGIRSDERPREPRALADAHGRRASRRSLAMIDAAGLAGIDQRVAGVARGRGAVAGGGDRADGSSARGVVVAGDRLVDADASAKAREALLALVAASHKAQPMSEGLPREEAREKIFARVAPAIFERVLDDLKAREALVGPDRLALPTHKATRGRRRRSRARGDHRRVSRRRPEAAGCGSRRSGGRRRRAPIVEKVTALLLREKVLVRLDTLVFHAEALQQLKEEVAALKGSAPGGRATVDVAAFKDRYGVSRKFAIPLLEYLDRERVTRRTGDVRLVL